MFIPDPDLGWHDRRDVRFGDAESLLIILVLALVAGWAIGQMWS